VSAAIAAARVDEIRQMMGALNGAPPVTPPATGDSSFQAQLAAAQTAPVAGAAPTGGTAAVGSGPVPYNAEIEAAAARHGLDPALLKALIRQESNFDPNAGSPAGAQGLTQLMPATARSLGVTNPHDPAQAIEGGAKYLKQQLDRFGGDVQKALAAYNAGPGAVARFGGIPPYAETQQYVQKVMAYAEQYRASAAPAPLPTASPAVAASPSQFGSIT
jgi:soluble lytic murein transglycosylase-like protein